MGLFNWFNNDIGEEELTAFSNDNEDDDEDDENNSPYDDDELDSYGLDEDEKKLVKEGAYDPWEFEEEDMDEDDYYAEDDL